MKQTKHKTNDTYLLKDGEKLCIPSESARQEYERITELAEHINNDMLPTLKAENLHPNKGYILAMCARPSLFPGELTTHEVREGDEKLLHFNGRKFIVNQCRLQQHFQQMA